MKRILIVGCSGSGKSTLAQALAKALNLPYVPTDHIYWSSEWQPTPKLQVRKWVSDITSSDSWVLDGNFDEDQDIVWSRAEKIIWLDLPLPLVVSRVCIRNLSWLISGKKIWGDKSINIRRAFSGIFHAFNSHGRKRKRYPLQLIQYPHLEIVRVKSSSELQVLQQSLPNEL